MIVIALLISAFFSWILYRKTNPDLTFGRRFFLFFLRLITLSIVLLFLLIPIYKVTKETYMKPKAIILNDKSASMDLLQEGQSKAMRTSNLLEELKANLQANFDLEYLNFSSTLEGNPNNTDLISSIEDLYIRDSETPDEIFLLSDGYYSDNRFTLLRHYPFKINTFEFTNPQKDLQAKILNIRSNRTAYLNEDTPLEISINTQGKQDLSLEILNNNEVIKRETIDISDDNIAKKISYLKFDQVGLYKLTIKLNSSEETLDSARLVLKVSDNKKNLVLITDSADWDLKFIKDAIKLDNNFSFKFIIVKDRKIWQANEEVNLEDIVADCQLLIINNKNRLIFNPDQTKLLNNKVNKGLSLFLIGEIIPGLEDFYPVTKTSIDRVYEAKIIPGYTSKNYTTFASYLQTADDLPPVKYHYYKIKNSGQEIATLDNMDRSPAITAMRLNSAKILHFAFTDFWRFSTRANKDDFNTLILNIVQWLSSKSGENFVVSTNKDGYYFGETVEITASILDEKGDFISQKNLQIEVTKDENQDLISDFLLWKSDQYRYELEDLTAGNYTYKVTDMDTEKTKEGEFIIFDNSLELTHQDFNNVALNQISTITGGSYYKSSQIESIKSALSREKIPTKLYKEYKILFNNYLLLIVILSFSIELFFRRRWGLI